jgi:hypothetical protein
MIPNWEYSIYWHWMPEADVGYGHATVRAPDLTPRNDALAGTTRFFVYLGSLFVPAPVIQLGGGLQVSDAALMAATAAAFLMIGRGESSAGSAFRFVAALAVAAGCISAVRSMTPTSELVWTLRLLFMFGVLPAVLTRALLLPQHVLRCVSAFVVGASASGLAAVMANFGFVLPWVHGQVSDRLAGLNVHPNGQGGTLAVAFVLSAGLIASQRQFRWILALLSCFLGLIMSGSISATTVTVIGTLFTIWRLKKRMWTVLAISAFSFVGWAAVLALQGQRAAFLTPAERLSSATGRTGTSTLALRMESIRFAWRHIVSSPFFGVGLSEEHARTFNGVTATHNMEMLAWYQGGALLFAGVCLLVVMGIVASLKARETLATVFSGGAITALLFAQTGPSLIDRYVWLPVIWMIIYHRIGLSQSESACESTVPAGEARNRAGIGHRHAR